MKFSERLNGGRLLLACVLSIAANLATAAPCTGVSVGTSSTDDVKLGGLDANRCVVSTVDPQQGSFNWLGFDSTFGSGWSLLAKIDGNGNVSTNPATAGGVSFTLGFIEGAGSKAGTWSIKTDKAAVFDLVFDMYAGSRSDAFLFDNFETAQSNKNGTWSIEWLNNGGQVPGYSSLTLFVRDVAAQPSVGSQAVVGPQAVPEPESGLLVLSALTAAALVTRRRKAGVAKSEKAPAMLSKND